MQEILSAFGFNAPVLKTERLSGGHMHETLHLHTASGDYLAQKLHPAAFPDPAALMRKLVSVTAYLRSRFPDCVTLHFYAANGTYLYNGWRVADWIPGVTADSRNLQSVCAAGRAFGKFQAMLCGFSAPAERPFHDPERRFAALCAAAEADPLGRFPAVRETFCRLTELQPSACALQHSGLPVRIVHNDTKLSNLLVSPETGKPLAVIDLDTVGWGLAAYDFGDTVRSLHGTAERLDMALVQAAADGFAEGADFLTRAERETLPLGIVSITAELAARYLTDFLTGDSYFHHPDSAGRAAQLTALAQHAASASIQSFCL